MWVPTEAETLPADAERPRAARGNRPGAGRSVPRRRASRWPLFVGIVLTLVVTSGGVAFFLKWGPFKPASDTPPDVTGGVPKGPDGKPKAGNSLTALPLEQHIKSLRVLLPGYLDAGGLDAKELVKRIHALYEPYGVKIVDDDGGNVDSVKEDAILVVTYGKRNAFGDAIDHEVTYVWVDARQQFLTTANSTKETTFGAFGTPSGFAEKFRSSFVPPLFLFDVRTCLTSRSVVDKDGGIFAFRTAVASDDGGHLFYPKVLSFPSEAEKKQGKKPQWELRVLDTKQNKVVAQQPCRGEEFFLSGTTLCCYKSPYGDGEMGLEIRDVSKLPEVGPPTTLFAGKKIMKVAAAGQYLCVLAEERLHVLALEKGAQPRELSVDDVPTANFWTGATGQVWMREAAAKGATDFGDLRLGRIDANGKIQVNGKIGLGDEVVAKGYEPHYALSDKWAASIGAGALCLFDLSSGKPTLVHKLDGVVGKDIVLHEDLCAVLDGSALRLFSIADPKNIQRIGDVPLGEKMPAKGALQDLSIVNPGLAFLLSVQSSQSHMRLVNDELVVHCNGITRNKEGAKGLLSSVGQVHRIELAKLRPAAAKGTP